MRRNTAPIARGQKPGPARPITRHSGGKKPLSSASDQNAVIWDREAARGHFVLAARAQFVNQASVSFKTRPPLAVDARTGMKTRKLGSVFVLLAPIPWLIGCETVRDSSNPQFEKQVQRAQECRQIQAKLVGDRPVTPERAEEIAKTMTSTGCAARLPGYY